MNSVSEQLVQETEMAKRKPRQVKEVGQEPGVTKVSVVRDYLATHPEAKNKEVVAALAEQGITVTPAYISVIRGGKKAKKAKKAGKPTGFNAVLRQEKTSLLRRIDAIDTLLE